MVYDVPRLAGELRAGLRGTVSTDRGDRAMYAVDASNYRVVPDVVVVPSDAEALATAVELAAAAGAPVTLRGGGTSMAGNAIGGVVIDTSRHVNKLLDLDPAGRTAVVEPGVILTDLLAAAAPHGLTFGADPSSASRATLGGMIANNACGAHSVAWGTTADNVESLSVVVADGSRLQTGPGPVVASGPGGGVAERSRAEQLAGSLRRLGEDNQLLIRRQFGSFSRQISGYALEWLLPERGPDLAKLMCGSEGTLAATLAATVRLTPLPPARALLVLGFPDAVNAADAVPLLLPHRPLTVESINATLIDRLPATLRRAAAAAGLPTGETWLLVEIGAESADGAADRARSAAEQVADGGLGAAAAVVTNAVAQAVLWRCRRDAAGLATRRPDGSEAWGGWEDAAVPPARLGVYLRGLGELMGRYELAGGSYGHFGEGCLHLRVNFDLISRAGVSRYRSFVEEATELVVSLGGSVSGEHGDGRARSELLRRMYGDEALAVFEQVKAVFDPTGVLNPHVIVSAARLDADLRQRGQDAVERPRTVFGYPEDGGDFVLAQRRCVGVGKCRQSTGGVMCPSYQVTHEERHSTRGRAHLLWEMLQGDVVTGGWRSTEVRDALDLCLSCKGCLADCPVNVDMATYKAEFTYHHYRGRPWARPRSHWSMGWLPVWAQVAGRAPDQVNALLRSPLRRPLSWLGGVAAERELPSFADDTFRSWWGHREAGQGQRVLLWPDTFTNHFSPSVGRSAVEVLEAAGLRVDVPVEPVCCGLTWVSTGQLGVARKVLQRSLRRIAPILAAGIPVVGLEPSCTAMLRHDATRLLPGNRLAQGAARSTYTLAEALERFAPQWRPPRVPAAALVQVHCHQHAVMGFDADRALMAAAGMAVTVPDSGCCGLAGNFGFERGHLGLSLAAAERVLMPAVRAAPTDTVIVADGFSCRTQIAHASPRTAHHLAEVLAAALNRGG